MVLLNVQVCVYFHFSHNSSHLTASVYLMSLSQALTSVVNFREPKSICKAPELVSTHTDTHTQSITQCCTPCLDQVMSLLVFLSSWRNTVTIY